MNADAYLTTKGDAFWFTLEAKVYAHGKSESVPKKETLSRPATT